MPLIVALILAVTLGAGLGAVSKNALPGDSLYPVKVNFAEEIRSLFEVTPASQSEWNLERMSRRLSEAQAIYSSNSASGEARLELASELEEAESSIIDDMSDLLEKQKINEAYAISEKFEKLLATHATNLGKLESSDDISDESRLAIRSELSDLRPVREQATIVKLHLQALASGGTVVPAGSGFAVSTSTEDFTGIGGPDPDSDVEQDEFFEIEEDKSTPSGR